MKKKRGLTKEDLIKALKILDKGEKDNPIVKTIDGGMIFFKGGGVLRWNDIKPRKKAGKK